MSTSGSGGASSSAGGTGGGVTSGTATSSGVTTGSGGGAVEGVWAGYIENFQFRSGSDALEVTVDALQGTAAEGSIEAGDQPALTPPTDPNTGYPPGATMEDLQFNGYLPYEGFAFTMLEGDFADDRLRFALDPREVWKAWCEIQTPVLWQEPDVYGCLPNWGYSFDGTSCWQPDPMTGMDVPVDCGQLALCQMMMVCECTAAACTVTLAPIWTFDLEVQGDDADGSVDGDGQIHNVHLTRAP